MENTPRILESAIDRQAKLVREIRRGRVNRQAMKDKHVARMYGPSCPIVSYSSSVRNLRYMKILALVLLNSETMRAFKNPQGPNLNGQS